MQQFQTKNASLKQIEALTDFQLNMAQETENFKLDRQLVLSALKYFLQKADTTKNNSYGIILIRVAGHQTLGSQMITFENDEHWWFQSVYIAQHARRQGHFTALFSEAVRLGKQKGVKNIKLYVQNNNQRAKSTYFRLGMKMIEDKMYSYDFVYGGFTFNHQKIVYSIKLVNQKSQQIHNWLNTKENILTGLKYVQNDWNFTFVIEKQGKIVGISKIFYEFSDWRFGLIWYMREIYLSQEQKGNQNSLLNEIMGKILQISQLKVAVIRIIYRQSQNLYFSGGHKEHYDILQIDL